MSEKNTKSIDSTVLSEKYLVSTKRCESSNTDGPSYLSRLFSRWEEVGVYDNLNQVQEFLKGYEWDKINNKCAFINSYGKTTQTLVFEHVPYWSSGSGLWEKYNEGEIYRSYELIRIKPLLTFDKEAFKNNGGKSSVL